LSISAMGAQLKHPERILGVHFFNPAPKMRLVEIIPGLQTDADVVERGRSLIDGWG
ncbi:MAG: 3-hydroxybutyryl-CoA dehydrogenase, partial [Saprospiraceae bacterium]|nr:3-hydroxybutyryl-CoA dehydrogenase [Saprospiraceae bacterium]